MLDDILSGAMIGGICGLIVFTINKLRGKGKISTVAVDDHNPSMSMAILGKGGFMNERLFPLPDSTICVGTDPSRCAVIYSKNVAGIAPLHCQIVPQNDDWLLIDFSEAGTWLNGKRLNHGQPSKLNIGDVFYLGNQDNSFVFQAIPT